ncbi:phospholipid methyltransferase family protein [Dictyostelium discoideum AX4]|uniref:Phosphatidylethanolamine N-methyltransferase A n=1 Tax=Dictyostelium discoideum TaxID=44689 RepID=PEMT1_DICDI|nr:phospholipid methyltransferase family protein [Dictyostelium discoideum AX4]Q54SD5.1 RecName: Full=Phosphatidylethanolamine N-methyltransferase A; Short=PEAMT; Short=PEMT; AltName: Full=Phospholipid methyltransferase A; Short=PLMT [Dictyostelium discoideum]EAL66123.1 phospholipid methyltransferase family protein [Dictyostelium discoideum AX4]|eukprot:XP_640104.1 phospholipid methyltransferase family protein [Dictyostelium discoideum AX4]
MIVEHAIDYIDYLMNYVDFTEKYFLLTIACVVFNPTWWNITARMEYKTKFMTKICGSKENGCYLLAFLIFSLGILRDWLFSEALIRQPIFQEFDRFEVEVLSYILYGFGGILVLAAYLKLGITGTYLGDYFGILMKERVTGFPFNVMNNPMYNGSVMLFIAHALSYKSVAGLVLSFVVYVVYKFALIFEESFTNYIYSTAAANAAKKNKSKSK